MPVPPVANPPSTLKSCEFQLQPATATLISVFVSNQPYDAVSLTFGLSEAFALKWMFTTLFALAIPYALFASVAWGVSRWNRL